jgi:N-acetylglucosamine malate deacetylase 2
MTMRLKSALALFAHPDDETVLAGGIIRLMTQQGVNVHIVSATRGEGGETGEPVIRVPRDELGAVRVRELQCAARTLGATAETLDYVDPLIGPDDALCAFDCDFGTLARQFGALAVRHRADLVLTHGTDGEYGHPAHVLVHRAVMEGVRAAAPQTMIYTVAADVPGIEDHMWNQNQPAHFAIDIRAWGEAKIAAMECHVTQHALFVRRRKLQTVREALRTVESVRRVHPEVYEEQPRDAFASLLMTAGAWMPQS